MVAITGFSDTTTDELRHVIEHLEGNHGDTLVFIADAAATSGHWVNEVAVLELEPERVVLDLIGAHGSLRHEIPFSEPIADMTGLQIQLFGLITQAREANPDAPMTSIETELHGRAAIPTHVVTVAHARKVGETMVEVTLVGLDAPVRGGDEFWYLMVPQPQARDVIGDGFAIGQLESIPEDRRPMGASYTTRRRRPEAGELDLWIHLHHDTGVAGWAATATVGDTVALWGPRVAYDPPEGTTHHLLVADETGVPAAAAIAESLPTDHPVTLIAEIGAPGHELPIRVDTNVDVRWVYRSDDGGRLPETVAALDLDTDGLYAFGAGESREISAIRRHLRRERGMTADAVHMTGYWRRGRDEAS
ncbi:MAG: siderophore-interacting protein [Actinomycetota bacterium]